MRLRHIALRNVRRHLSRSLLLATVIAVSVTVVCTLYLVARSAQVDLETKVDEYGANIVVAPRTKELPLSYGGVSLGGLTYDAQPLTMADVAAIRTIEEKQTINKVAPKLVESTEVQGVRVLVVGVDWSQELGLKQWWAIDGRAPATDREVLAGSRAFDRLELREGGTLTLRGEELVVTGRLQPTGTQEDDLLFLDLGTVQRLWQRPDEVSFVEVSAWCSSCPIETINAQISAALPQARVSALLKAAESREILVGQFRLFALVLSVLMVLVGCLIVLTSTLGSVRDRRGEIGVFRAMGFRRRHVLSIILVENLALALVGGLIGVVVAWAVSGTLARTVAGVTGGTSAGALELGAALGVSLVVVLAASLYPAVKAARLSPMLAMRRV